MHAGKGNTKISEKAYPIIKTGLKKLQNALYTDDDIAFLITNQALSIMENLELNLYFLESVLMAADSIPEVVFSPTLLVKYRQFYLNKANSVTKICCKRRALVALLKLAQTYVLAKDTSIQAKGTATFELVDLYGKAAEVPKDLKVKVMSDKTEIKATHSVKGNIISVTPETDSLGIYQVSFDLKSAILRSHFKIMDTLAVSEIKYEINSSKAFSLTAKSNELKWGKKLEK